MSGELPSVAFQDYWQALSYLTLTKPVIFDLGKRFYLSTHVSYDRCLSADWCIAVQGQTVLSGPQRKIKTLPRDSLIFIASHKCQ